MSCVILILLLNQPNQRFAPPRQLLWCAALEEPVKPARKFEQQQQQ
jgi:hypothetical protein